MFVSLVVVEDAHLSRPMLVELIARAECATDLSVRAHLH